MLTAAHRNRLQQLWQEGEAHDARHSARADKRLNITPDTGLFLYQLARARKAMALLEIGTSNGYSAVWLGLAAQANKGRLRSVDNSAHKTALASAMLDSFGLQQSVSLHTADAFELLAACDDESVDMLFLDADRSRYAGYWPEIARILAPRAVLVMDNAVSHAEECADFRAAVLATHGYLAETYPIGKGQFVILKDL
ncbi:O-methyltransferase [Vogesella sp. LIG4]|uniref:O-methyltransferase n=1 Tax=Vogesella sp. LIG4 TaxID=1192162 RepID=UPI0008202231|nr:class I SAM-dependent methyltransferase [Vogesella sp. LIG4]SCK23499.1 Predicted O-methyltransferase YrrM [Vogesella sp. LIG4]